MDKLDIERDELDELMEAELEIAKEEQVNGRTIAYRRRVRRKALNREMRIKKGIKGMGTKFASPPERKLRFKTHDEIEDVKTKKDMLEKVIEKQQKEDEKEYFSGR